MCLENISELKIAKSDLIRYKVVIPCNDYFKTPYARMDIRLNTLYKSRLIVSLEYNKNIVNEGIHTFKTLKEAKAELNTWSYPVDTILKCIIPKGSKYYDGKFRLNYKGDTVSSTASDKIIYKEVIYTR